MNVLKNEGELPIKMWLEDVEDKALEQARNLARLPFAFRHIALMPDCHMGYGMPIGGVLATKGQVIPNAVGVDIGCGMLACQTDLIDISIDDLKKIMNLVRKAIPVGFKRHDNDQPEELMPEATDFPDSVVIREYDKALKQLGTLGGGNHFIEFQKGSDGNIWIMIHSGSRNVGLQVAKHYNDCAKFLNKQFHSEVVSSVDLAHLPLHTEIAYRYIMEMEWCVDFAKASRDLMLFRIKECILEVTGAQFTDHINIAHNYAQKENHFGENVMVHRKGATFAGKGTRGIIPGSQGTQSYIVKGLGNKESFNSCSHGAGRKMGRKQAIRELDLAAEKKALDAKGIIHSVRSQKQLDEAPSAYKDIAEVMENQKDLVEILVELTPLGVIKG